MSAEFLELPSIDGANPLGFLAALGTLMTVRQASEKQARLRWKRTRTWVPVLDGISTSGPGRLSDTVAGALRGRAVSDDDEKKRAATQREFDAAKKAVEDKKKEIRDRGLSKKDRETAIEQEVRPLEQVRNERRQPRLDARKKAVPRPELAIGKRIDCTYEEYHEHAGDFLEGAGHADREALDLLAAFGSDACRSKSKTKPDEIEPTPFCFTTGSGHQFFLETVRQLMEQVKPDRVRQVLFEPWAYRDEKFSMRWDPAEDRRYALMDRDPTASDNKSRTVWMANLLAYRALPLFPCAPGRRGLGTTAWALIGEEDLAFTWPIWEFAAPPDTIRSLLQLSELVERRCAALPRRLVYVVDQRAVVDQATDVAKSLRAFVDRDPELRQALGLGARSLPISTLRGRHRRHDRLPGRRGPIVPGRSRHLGGGLFATALVSRSESSSGPLRCSGEWMVCKVHLNVGNKKAKEPDHRFGFPFRIGFDAPQRLLFPALGHSAHFGLGQFGPVRL